MIFGDCPHCNHPHTFTVPITSHLPLFKKVVCDNCDQIFYEYLSRINPQAYKPEELIINEETHSIKIKEEVL